MDLLCNLNLKSMPLSELCFAAEIDGRIDGPNGKAICLEFKTVN